MGSTCSMLNDNDHMASTITLQSHIQPEQTLEPLDEDEIEAEKNVFVR